MQLSVLVQPVSGNGFRASTGAPLSLEAEGQTQDEALKKLRALVTDCLAQGAAVVPLDVDSEEHDHPWLAFAGILNDDPLVERWKQAMAEYRRQVDEDPDAP